MKLSMLYVEIISENIWSAPSYVYTYVVIITSYTWKRVTAAVSLSWWWCSSKALFFFYLTSQRHIHSNLVQKEDCTNLSQSFLNWSSLNWYVYVCVCVCVCVQLMVFIYTSLSINLSGSCSTSCLPTSPFVGLGEVQRL